MNFVFDKPACQNIRRSMLKEWLQTNDLGDYSSGTVPACNTRKYHGLLVANLNSPSGRHVLLSTLEESVAGGGKEFLFSTRKHPGVYFPRGYNYLESMEHGGWTVFRFRIGSLLLTRELVLLRDSTVLLLKYSTMVMGGDEEPPLVLRLKPQLAFRNIHALTRANLDLQVSTFPAGQLGFSIRPYNALPQLFMQLEGSGGFYPAPDWCYNVEYFMEQERGFPGQEDLFMPGLFETALRPGEPVYLSASLDELAAPLSDLWEKETIRRRAAGKAASGLREHLAAEGQAFLSHVERSIFDKKHANKTAGDNAKKMDLAGGPQAAPLPPSITAGFHWFGAWGRDTMIALPGLTFAAGRGEAGKTVLAAAGQAAKAGLIPNLFARGSVPAAYNSIDASLWYVWAVQQLLVWMPGEEDFVYQNCWPVIRDMVRSYARGGPGAKALSQPRIKAEALKLVAPKPGQRAKADEPDFDWPPLFMDEQGLLHAGNSSTQLTWMDANAYGHPVTPRHGCPVEINALWYNALAFIQQYGGLFAETDGDFNLPELLANLAATFKRRFWSPADGGWLGDVWRDGWLDASIRPNQIFAVSLPYSMLDETEQACVVECVRNNLLTPYGLRTLSPKDAAYRGQYAGGPNERDSAYHQGTVWPWLLGAYGDALLKAAWDVPAAARGLLDTVTPLFSSHLRDAGLGSISEIFGGNPPHPPNGCIAQAWSVAECYRLLRRLEAAAPEEFAAWDAAREALCGF